MERFFKNQLGNRVSKLEIRDVKKQGKDYLKDLDQFNLIVRSPGIPYLLPEIQKAKKKGVEVTSATKLFFSAIGGSALGGQNAKGVLIGITGTKGKGTTATLLYKILKASRLAARPPSGRNIHLIGNMGIPMLDELPKLNRNSISILELSSFQLQDLDVSPHIAVVLDISPDHLDYHKSFNEYLEAKFPISNYQFSKNKIFYFPDNKFSRLVSKRGNGKKIAVRPDASLVLRPLGHHNLKNASMAAAVARAFGVSEKIVRKTIKNFKGLPHRLEFTREIRGIKFYNDSASTNPAATAAAIKAFSESKILIAGGAGKNLDYKPIGRSLKNSNTKLIILYGKNKKEIGSAIGGADGKNIKIFFVNNLESAVALSFNQAKSGDVVLLSPASTAFDQFTGYGERGDCFKKYVAKLR